MSRTFLTRSATRIAVAGALALTMDPAMARAVAPPELQPPDAKREVASLSASGVQIYVCKRNDNHLLTWAFQAPEAELRDADGKLAIRHYAGPTWEAPDGSKIIGKVLRQVPNKRDPGSIALLLLETSSAGGPGMLGAVRYVQRLNTRGGAQPAQPCPQEGQERRVPYAAEYVFLE